MKNFIRLIEPDSEASPVPLYSVQILMFLPYLDPLNEFEIISEEVDSRKFIEILIAMSKVTDV